MSLLRRYGVVARALLAREALAPAWRELLPIYRSAEARGEIRGGRFVEPLGGEQFALIEAVEELRRVRRVQALDDWLALSVADPVNLASFVGDAARTNPPTRRLVFRNGAVVAAEGGAGIDWRAELSPADQRRVAELLGSDQRAQLRHVPRTRTMVR
jgi:ATP-dependent Lhr-like helicase